MGLPKIRTAFSPFFIRLLIATLLSTGAIYAQDEPPSGMKELFEQQQILATRFTERGDFLGAQLAIERALELEPDWSDGWRRLAIIDKALGERAKATKALKQALELNPSDA